MKRNGLAHSSAGRLQIMMRCFAAVFLFSAGLPAVSLAGAWTQDKHHGQMITTFSLLRTSQAFDGSRSAKRFPDAGQFRQFTINPYIQYGLTSRNTLVLNAQIPFLKYSNAYGSWSSAGTGDIEASLRTRLNSPDSSWAWSSQLSAMFPSYRADRNPAPGNHQEDVEARILIGHGGTLWQRRAWWDAQAAYRIRFGAPADQIRCDLTAGMDLAASILFMAQYFHIRGLRRAETIDIVTNPNAQFDFDLQKFQCSFVISVAQKTRLQAGGNAVFAGRNIGRDRTAILALWRDF